MTSAVNTVQQMITAGVRWQVEGSAVKLQAGTDVPPELVKSINQNRREVVRLVKCNPDQEQLEALRELESLNRAWALELEKDAQGYPGEDQNVALSRLASMVDRATELYEQLVEQNPVLLQGVHCLYP